MGKTITIIIMALAVVGLTVSTVLLAVNSASKGSEIEQLTTKVEEYETESEKLNKRIKRVAMASCLMEGYELTNASTAATCRSNVNFIINKKTDADLDELLTPLGY